MGCCFPAAQVFSIDGEGGWTHEFVGQTGAIDLGALSAPVPLAELYAGVEFPD